MPCVLRNKYTMLLFLVWGVTAVCIYRGIATLGFLSQRVNHGRLATVSRVANGSAVAGSREQGCAVYG